MERKWWTLLIVCVATFMLLLDVTIVNVALPVIEADLKTSFSDLQWVVDAYALTLAAFLLTFGSLADRYGRRLIFVAGLVVFSVASLLCGLSTSPLSLNLARGLQGVGGAAMFATALALLATAFSGRERGTALGVWGATTGAAVAIGPLVGGVLTDGIGWEAIFFINVPIGALAVALALAKIEESRSPAAHRPDIAGLVLFSAALFMLIFALIRGNPEGWGSPLIVGLLLASAATLAAFLAVERAGKDPMLDLRLFRKPAFVGASVTAFVLSASMFSMFLYLTLYIQNIQEFTPLQAGLRFLPVTLLSFAVAPVAGKLSARLPVRLFLGAGLALVGAGLLLMRSVSPGDAWTALLPGFMVAGLGIGLTNPPLASAAIGVVAPQQSGMASGINSTFRQVGIATGIAALGALFQHAVAARAAELLAGAPGGRRLPSGQQLSDFIAFGGAQRTGNQALIRAAEDAFVAGLDRILLVAAVVAFAGAVVALVLVRQRDFAEAAAPAPTAPRRVAEPVG